MLVYNFHMTTQSVSTRDDMENQDADKAAKILWKVISPLLLILGTFGNILVITVLTRKSSRKVPTSIFLSALAVSDLLALLTGLLRQWIRYVFETDIRTDISVSGCRFHWFIVYLVTQFSSWMLICVTAERVASTLVPHKSRVIFTIRNALILVCTVFVVLVLLNGHYLFGYGYKNHTYENGQNETERCVPITDRYESFIIYTWTWIDLCVFYLIPFIVLLVGNTLIINKVITSHRKSRRAVVPGNDTRNARMGNFNHAGAKISSLTLTLLLVSAVFFICITPIVVYPIGEPYWADGASEKKLASLFLIETIANLLMYINHSINFVLYFLSGRKFRNEVKLLFCRRRTTQNETETSAGASRADKKPNIKTSNVTTEIS